MKVIKQWGLWNRQQRIPEGATIVVDNTRHTVLAHVEYFVYRLQGPGRILEVDLSQVGQVHIMIVSECDETVAEQLMRFYSQHDWRYEMSDDHSVWQRGSKQAEIISKIEKVATPEECLAALTWAFRMRVVPDEIFDRKREEFLKEIDEPPIPTGSTVTV